MVELAALLTALFDGTEPLLDPDELKSLHAEPEQRFWLLRDLQQLLERAALASPLLVAIDDAHWADGGTIAAIRALAMRLTDLPIVWVLALRPPRETTPLVRALEQMGQHGAPTVVLGPLEGDAVARLAADMLGAEADQLILQLLAEADGSPFLIVEMLLGLREEDRIRVVGDRAQLIGDDLPRRVHNKMRDRLGRLSAGRATPSPSPPRLAEPSRSPSSRVRWAGSIRAVRSRGELLEANLSCRTRGAPRLLARHHPRSRPRSSFGVGPTCTRPLGGRGPPQGRRAAGRRGDAARDERRARRRARGRDPARRCEDPVDHRSGTAAASVGGRSRSAGPRSTPRRDRQHHRDRAPHRGNSDEAIAFADRALRETFPAAQEAEVRLSIAGMFAISPEIRIGAGRLALPARARRTPARPAPGVPVPQPGDVRPTGGGAGDGAEAEAVVSRPAIEPPSRCTSPSAPWSTRRTDFGAGPASRRACREGLADDDQRLRLAQMWQGDLLSVLDRTRMRSTGGGRARGGAARPPGLGLPDVRDVARPPAAPPGSSPGGGPARTPVRPRRRHARDGGARRRGPRRARSACDPHGRHARRRDA